MRSIVLVLGCALAAVTACSSTPDAGPLFNNENFQDVTCMTHQSAAPGARYTAVEQRSTAEVLALMRYYTANGAKPFCDKAAATETDKAWAKIYVGFGGATDKVASVLG